MAMYRKLSRPTAQRKAMLRSGVTQLIWKGRIVTTEPKAKEIKKIAESLIALGIKERDNFEEVTVSAKVPKKDKDGHRVKEEKDGKKVTVYETVEKTIKKDQPSRLHARRQMHTKEVNLPNKIFDEYAPKYADRKGGYTRIVKIGQRKGDGALEVVLELV